MERRKDWEQRKAGINRVFKLAVEKGLLVDKRKGQQRSKPDRRKKKPG